MLRFASYPNEKRTQISTTSLHFLIVSRTRSCHSPSCRFHLDHQYMMGSIIVLLLLTVGSVSSASNSSSLDRTAINSIDQARNEDPIRNLAKRQKNCIWSYTTLTSSEQFDAKNSIYDGRDSNEGAGWVGCFNDRARWAYLNPSKYTWGVMHKYRDYTGAEYHTVEIAVDDYNAAYTVCQRMGYKYVAPYNGWLLYELRYPTADGKGYTKREIMAGIAQTVWGKSPTGPNICTTRGDGIYRRARIG